MRACTRLDLMHTNIFILHIVHNKYTLYMGTEKRDTHMQIVQYIHNMCTLQCAMYAITYKTFVQTLNHECRCIWRNIYKVCRWQSIRVPRNLLISQRIVFTRKLQKSNWILFAHLVSLLAVSISKFFYSVREIQRYPKKITQYTPMNVALLAMWNAVLYTP